MSIPNQTSHNHNQILHRIHHHLEPWLDSQDNNERLDENTNLIMQIGLDSVSILQLIMGLEKDYKIRIHEHELESNTFSKLGNLIELIKTKIHETH